MTGRFLNAGDMVRPGIRTLRQRLMDLAIHVSRRSLAGPLRFLGRLILFVTIAGGAGLSSVWYMVQVGSPLTVERTGPWSRWINDGRPDTDPYTRAHDAWSGRMKMSSTQAQYYLATNDSAGDKLFGDCEYDLAGTPRPAVWWSIAIYDSRGALIDNDFDRFAMTGDTVVRGSDGSYVIRLAQDARPGNWLPVGTDGRFVILIRVYQPTPTNDLGPTGGAAGLPVITKVSCR